MLAEKPIVWVGSSLADLRALPEAARRDIGFALSAAQVGQLPGNGKPLKGVGGVYEILTDFDRNTYRTVYAVNLGRAIYVLHVFQKKAKQGIATPKPDLELIRARLKAAKKDAEHG